MVHAFALKDLTQEKNRRILVALYLDPERLKPETAASEFASLAVSLGSRGVEPRQAAHFLDRILFCLFAEDVGLLPGRIFLEPAISIDGNPRSP